MSPVNPETEYDDEVVHVAWGVELEFLDQTRKSVFHSARKIVMDGKYVQVQLPDGNYESYPINHVRKVLAMRAKPALGYTDEDLSDDELY